MTKVIGMLVALAMFCAMPAAAFGDEPHNGGNGNHDGGNGNGNGNGDNGNGNGGNGNGNGGKPNGDGGITGGDAIVSGGDGGGDAQGCAASATAGGNATATNNCFNKTNVTDADGDGVGDDDEVGVGGGGVGGAGGGVGGGGVQGVTLARTGFDAWLLAAIGGLSLAGGLGLLAAQRRGRIGA